LTVALSSAIHECCRALLGAVLDLVAADDESPLRGMAVADVAVGGGRIFLKGDERTGDSYAGILARHRLDVLSADGVSTPADPTALGLAHSGAFGAKFVEVRVDPDLGVIRIPRITSVIDGGRILNEKLARSQIIGGTVGGIGQALLEQTVTDESTGRIANATLGDYLVPVNADIGELDVVFVGDADRMTPIGAKGIGEIGLAGTAAAIANAVFHATGRRVRSLPITIEAVLGLTA
jgi:xanthine dehydrogenase YagR molybdenum-binding subunit